MNFSFFMDIFFPRRCFVCGSAGEHQSNAVCCSACFASIPIARGTLDHDACGGEYVLGAATSYEHRAAKTLIHRLKFDYMQRTAEPLGDILAEYALRNNLITSHAAVIPIPLSKKRERRRGFNQSLLIAEHFIKKLVLHGRSDVHLEKNVLARVRHTKPQTETMTAAERRENVRDCFGVLGVPPPTVVLIDDVVTTGSTLCEAARVLRAAGTKDITLLAVARA